MKRNRILICIFFIGVAILFFILFYVNNSNNANNNSPRRNSQENLHVSESKSEIDKDEEKQQQESNEQTAEKNSSNIPSSNNSNKSNDTNVTLPNEDTQKHDTTKSNSEKVVERQCIVKKFYSVFRADFNNFDECNKKGNELKEKNNYYGFTCDYQTDDCGDIYYMLTFFDGNGNFIDYPSVPKS